MGNILACFNKTPTFVDTNDELGSAACSRATSVQSTPVSKVVGDCSLNYAANSSFLPRIMEVDHNGQSEFVYAVRQGQMSSMEALLEQCNVSQRELDKALKVACTSSSFNLDIIRFLVGKGATVPSGLKRERCGIDNAFEALCRTKREAMGVVGKGSERLGSVYRIKVDDARKRLEQVEEAIRFLVGKGVGVNARDFSTNAQTPLMLAVVEKDLAFVQLCLKSDADVSLKDNLGRTATFLSSGTGDTEIMKELRPPVLVQDSKSLHM